MIAGTPRAAVPAAEESDSPSGAETTAGRGDFAAADAARREALRWAVTAAAAADERKAEDVVVIDVGDLMSVTELFVITHGRNARQVRAVFEGVEEGVKSVGGPSPLSVEGAEQRQWVLLDFGAFVVHVFDAERRAFYQLESLWSDCPALDWRGLKSSLAPAT